MIKLQNMLARAEHMEIAALAEAEKCEAKAGELQAIAAGKRERLKNLKRLRSRMQGLQDVIATIPADLVAELQMQRLFGEVSTAPVVVSPAKDVPPPQKPLVAPAPVAPVVVEPRPLPMTTTLSVNDPAGRKQDETLDERVMGLIGKVAETNGGQALFDLSKLAEKAGTSPLRLDKALTRLAEAGRLLRRKSVPGHAAFEVLPAPADEVAA